MRPKKEEVELLRAKLMARGRESVEFEGAKPPITIVCTDPADSSFEVRIKMDVDARGKLDVVEEHGILAQIPLHINVRIIDADGRTIETSANK
jgi:hypothetical protein